MIFDKDNPRTQFNTIILFSLIALIAALFPSLGFVLVIGAVGAKMDILAWAETQAANGLTDLTAVVDNRYRSSGDNQIIRNMPNGEQAKLLAVLARGANLTRARIVDAAKNLSVIDLRAGITTVAAPAIDQALLSDYPLNPEAVLTGAVDNANNNEDAQLITIIGYGLPENPLTWAPPKPPSGALEVNWFTAVGAATLTAGLTVVDDVTLTWTGLVADHYYAILGFAGWSAEAFAFTLDINGFQDYRPGWFAGISSATARPIYLKEGYRPVFRGSTPPNARFYTSAADSAQYVTCLLADLGKNPRGARGT